MDTFNDASLTPEQIKMLTLQFMGQHLTGDLKELDKNLVAKNSTLQGMILNPEAVLNSIPSNAVPHIAPPPPTPTLTQQVVSQPTVASINIDTATQPEATPVDRNQLEFNFNTSPLSESIFEALQRIEKKLSIIEERLYSSESFKKKD